LPARSRRAASPPRSRTCASNMPPLPQRSEASKASSVPVTLPALPTCAGTIPRYAACEIELTSARPEGYYHNPFTNVAVQAQFTNGSQTLTAYGFYDGGRTWRIRFAPQTEEHPAAPMSPYGCAKLAIDQYLYFYRKVHGIRAVSLRYGNVYGPRQRKDGEAGVVAIFAGALLDGQTPRINGNGEQTRDYVFVQDVMRANIAASELEIVLRNAVEMIPPISRDARKATTCRLPSHALAPYSAPPGNRRVSTEPVARAWGIVRRPSFHVKHGRSC